MRVFFVDIVKKYDRPENASQNMEENKTKFDEIAKNHTRRRQKMPGVNLLKTGD